MKNWRNGSVLGVSPASTSPLRSAVWLRQLRYDVAVEIESQDDG